MILTLNRDAPRMDCQEGILEGGTTQWYTIEQPWNDDKPMHSCIPKGTYQLIPHTVVNGPLAGLQTWALFNATLGVFPEPVTDYDEQYPQRVACLIHPANQAWQLEGCIAPGKSRGLIDIGKGLQPSVLSSKDAFAEIVELLGQSSTGNTLVIQ
jgi:Family of unknown function (DUF5675)